MAVKDKPHGPVSEHFMRHYYGASKPAPTPHPDSHGHWDHAQISELLHERDALQAENLKLREACASGWGEPALINTLQAELAEARRLLRRARQIVSTLDPTQTEVVPRMQTMLDAKELMPAIDAALAQEKKG